MSAVHETLQQLVQRRQREMGAPGDPISTRQVWLRGGGQESWSYETVRRIVEEGHHRIGDKIADALAVALDVPGSKVMAAAGQRPRLGRFELPRRADRLTEHERGVVVSVVDAILEASAQPARADDGPGLRSVARRRGSGGATRRT